VIYCPAGDFRRVLDDRLTNQARADQAVDPHRLRTSVAFERFLARLFHDGTKRWVLKGGHALELRYPGRARTSLDLGLNVTPAPYPDQRVLLADKPHDAILLTARPWSPSIAYLQSA